MAKAGQPLKVADLSADLKAGVVDGKAAFALPLIYFHPGPLSTTKCLACKASSTRQAPKTWFEMRGILDQAAGCRNLPIHHPWPGLAHVDKRQRRVRRAGRHQQGALTSAACSGQAHRMMATWSKGQLFPPVRSPQPEASQKSFIDGECAMITTDSVRTH